MRMIMMYDTFHTLSDSWRHVEYTWAVLFWALLTSPSKSRLATPTQCKPRTITSGIERLVAEAGGMLGREWSLFTRGCEKDLVPVCRELGIGFLAYRWAGAGVGFTRTAVALSSIRRGS